MNDEQINDPAHARLERIVERLAAHFPSMAPAIRAVAWHVVADVDGVTPPDDLNGCRCLGTAGA